MALCVGVMKCKKCKCRRRTWLLTTGTPPGAKATRIAGSAGEIRLCMDTSPAWWAERAIRWMTRYDSRLSRRPARVYVCRVCMIFGFCISAAVLRAVFSCIVTVYALWCSRRLNLTAEIATLPAHTCTQVHRPTQPKQADAYLGEIDVSRCI